MVFGGPRPPNGDIIPYKTTAQLIPGGWLPISAGACEVPVPYDGKITDMVLNVVRNTLYSESSVVVYTLFPTGTFVFHEFKIPALNSGKWFMPKKRLPRLKKGDTIMVGINTGNSTSGSINPIVSIAYQKEESMRVKSKPVDYMEILE
jgi:hypothetical protein